MASKKTDLVTQEIRKNKKRIREWFRAQKKAGFEQIGMKDLPDTLRELQELTPEKLRNYVIYYSPETGKWLTWEERHKQRVEEGVRKAKEKRKVVVSIAEDIITRLQEIDPTIFIKEINGYRDYTNEVQNIIWAIEDKLAEAEENKAEYNAYLRHLWENREKIFLNIDTIKEGYRDCIISPAFQETLSIILDRPLSAEEAESISDYMAYFGDGEDEALY